MEPLPNKNKRENAQWVISYLTLRRSVGILGIASPVILFFGFLILDPQCEFPPSISHFYFTNLGTYFTGTLCAVSLFLLPGRRIKINTRPSLPLSPLWE